MFIDAIAQIPEVDKFFQGMEAWNYSAVGTLQFIHWNKKTIVDSSLELNVERLVRLVGAIAECQFEAIVDAHTASCGGGYMDGMCPPEICPVPS